MSPISISTFDELLAAARAQLQPQRLLLVFAGAGLAADATPQQQAQFAAGEGGELTPLMCVDKSPADIVDFTALCEESRQAGPPWAIVFAAALSVGADNRPDGTAADASLRRMVDDIRRGALASMVAFDREGRAVELN